MTAISTFKGPPDSLPLDQMKEQLSIAYVRMIVAAAGCSASVNSTDFDAVDIGVHSSASYEVRDEPRFDVQLKCTSQDVVRDEHVSWKVDERTHRKLTNPKRAVPAVIGVLVVPQDAGLWLDHDEERLLTASTMYYMEGRHMPPLPSGQGSITLHIPRRNLFNVNSVLDLMHDIGNGVA